MSNITPLDALIALGEIEVVSNGIPTNAEEYKSMMYRVDGVPINATWEQVVAKMAEMPTAEEQAAAKENLKASAKAKLIAGEPLTSEEADTIVL
jgi:hypothetical protein